MRILIADDDPTSCLALELVLARWGYDVVVASDGREALAVLEADDAPEIAILDWMMPELDGVEVCRRVRAGRSGGCDEGSSRASNRPYPYLIVLTSRREHGDMFTGLDAGADDYVTKPFNLLELEARLCVGRRVLANQRELRRHIGLLEGLAREREQALALVAGQQQVILQASKMSALGEMAGGVAHEINNPLAVVASAARQIEQAAARGPVDAAFVAGNAGKIRGAATRITQIVGGLLAFAREDRSDDLRSVNVPFLVEETLQLCRERLRVRGIQLTVDAGPDDPWVACRSGALKQALFNLLINAADAVEGLSGAWVHIALSASPSAVDIAVSDSGRGVPAAIREDIFQPFFTTKPVGRGAGLGLSIAKGIVESHGGELFLDATHAHTRFVARIPAQPPRVAKSVGRGPHGPASSTGRSAPPPAGRGRTLGRALA